MSYKLSVIIPTYNAEKYLLKSINSLVNQTLGFENIEVIIVDDGSTDNTPNIINGLSDKYDNIKIFLSDENTGTASSPRNIGIMNSTSDYIMFLDNDDEYCVNMCEVMYSNILSNNVDVVTCRYYLFKSNNISKPKSFLDNCPANIFLNDIDDFPEILTLGFPTMVWTKIFRKEIILDNKIMFPKSHLYEDVYFTSKFYLNAKGILILNDFFGYKYNVRLDEENKSTSQTFNKVLVEKQLNGFLDVMNLIDNDKEKFSFLFNEMIVDMSKIFLYSDLDNEYQKHVAIILNRYYKIYSLSSRIHTSSLQFNIIINSFIFLFSKSINLTIFVSNLFRLIVKK